MVSYKIGISRVLGLSGYYCYQNFPTWSSVPRFVILYPFQELWYIGVVVRFLSRDLFRSVKWESV